MKLTERLLLFLSKTHIDSHETSEEEWNQNNALSLLTTEAVAKDTTPKTLRKWRC